MENNDISRAPFGEVIKIYRKRSRLTQRQVAEKLGVHYNTVWAWECGDHLPETKGMVLELAKHLRLNGHETRHLLEASLTALSPHWHVPYPRNRFFTGREEVLQQVHAMLADKKVATLPQSFTLSGLGGIGKTQTALEYAYRYAQEYTAVLWIHAETPESMVTSFASIARLLHIPEHQESDQHKLVTAIGQWLTSHQDWLLIVDNLEDIALLKQFLPSTRHGSLLFTSRLQTLGTHAQSIEIAGMTVEESIRLLLYRAGHLAPGAPLEQSAQHDILLARAIAEAMDGLPLAIDQAGAYISETQCDIAEYLQLYQTYPLSLLDERDGCSDHPASVVRTFTLAFENLLQRNPAAADLLRVCSFLAPDAIPERLLIEGAGWLGPMVQSLAADPRKYHAAIKDLLAYSLIQRNPATKTLTIHRLVQAVLKETMPEEEQEQWARRMFQAIDQVFPSERLMNLPLEQWAWCRQILPHALIGAALSGQWNDTFPEASSFLLKLANILRDRAQFAEAKPFYQRARVLCEQVSGPAHPNVVPHLNNLGQLYVLCMKDSEAESLYRRALVLCKQELGPAHPHTAQSLLNLGILLYYQGKDQEAETLLQQALAIYEQALGPVHLDTATCLSYLATFIIYQGKYAEAEPLLQRVLMIREQNLGPAHPSTAMLLNNLATVYQELGKSAEAEVLLQRTLAILEQELGPTHLHTATSLNSLGVLYLDQGKYAEAEPFLQQTLAIRKQALVASHVDTAQSLLNLGVLYLEQGKDTEAEPLFQQALVIRRKEFGPSHARLGQSLYYLGMLFLYQGRYTEAEPLFQQALAIYEQKFGPTRSRTAPSLNGLGVLYLKQGKYTEAELLFQRALMTCEQDLGSTHPSTAVSLNNLAMLCQEQEKNAQAESFYVRALSIRERQLGSAHPDTARSLTGLARVYEKQGTYEQAEALLQRACTIFEQRLGRVHPETVKALQDYQSLLEHRRGGITETLTEERQEHATLLRETACPNGSPLSVPLKEAEASPEQETNPLTDFLASCCELHPRAWSRASDIWHAYEQWAEGQQERFPLSRRALTAQLQAYGCRANRTKTARIWRGIAIVKKDG